MTARPPRHIEPQKVELALAQLDAIPPLGTIATRILTLTHDPGTNAKEVVDLIAADPALTARILSILNRAEYGVRTEVLTVDNAVRMLGFDRIRQITLALKVMEAFGPSGPRSDDQGFDRGEFWKHCLTVACAARQITLALQTTADPEEAFVFGLLHDLGKIALATAMPKSFLRVVQRCDQTRSDIADVERAVVGVDHTVVGRRLAERWGLPSKLIECIWLHHQPAEALPASVAADGHVQVVQLADTLAREQRIGYSGNHCIGVSSRDLARGLGLSEEHRQGIIESLGDEVEQRAVWIGAEEINTREVYLRALMQTTDELTTANSALSEQNRRLERKAQYFAALRGLSRSISPRAPVREVCGAGAKTLRDALSVSAMLVFAVDEDHAWVHLGICDGPVRCDLVNDLLNAADVARDAGTAIEMACAGTWIAPPAPGFRPLVDRYRGRLGEGTVWLLPIVREQRWIGGALFGAPAGQVASLRAESSEIEGLSAALGLAISQARAQGAAIAMGEELAEINRRLVAMRGELLRAETLKTTVAMAAGAAHELNNPLAVISGRAQMLRQRLNDDKDVRETLNKIIEQAHVCSDIVTDLMDFARSPEPIPDAVDLKDCIESLGAELASAGLLEDGQLVVEVASDTPPAWFDPQHLTHVFNELLLNAIDSTDACSRRLTVKAASHLTEECIAVTVADNGRGMATDVLGRALDPFFSDRPAGRGRGLGLARVQRWLQQGGGTIRIESESGRGTRVELRLPMAHGRR